MDVYTLPEVRAAADPRARLLLAYGLLENAFRALDRVDSFPRFGERVQREEPAFGSELTRDVNFALGVRNGLFHGGRPADPEVERATNHFLRAAQLVIARLDQPDQQRLLGTDYRPPAPPPAQKKQQKQPKQPAQQTKKVAKTATVQRTPSPRIGKLDGVCGHKLMSAVLGESKKREAVLNKLAALGFSVSSLRGWTTIRPADRERLKTILSEYHRVTSGTNGKLKVVAVRQYNAHFDPAAATFRELRAIMDALLVLGGRHPRTGKAVPEPMRAAVYAGLGHPPNRAFGSVPGSASPAEGRSGDWGWAFVALFALAGLVAAYLLAR